MNGEAGDLAVIEAALKAATPGPWEAFRQRARVAGPDFIGVLRDIPTEYNTDIFATQSCRAEDAELIALLRNSAAELVERVKVAEAAIERVRALLGDGPRRFIRAGEVSDAIEGREKAGDWCDSMCEVCRCCPHEWATNCHCPDPDCGCLPACQCALCVDGDA